MPYAQPYVIAGVGDQASLLQAIDEDAYLAVYREQAAQPDDRRRLGRRARRRRSTAPGYAGLTDLTYATRPADR